MQCQSTSFLTLILWSAKGKATANFNNCEHSIFTIQSWFTTMINAKWSTLCKVVVQPRFVSRMLLTACIVPQHVIFLLQAQVRKGAKWIYTAAATHIGYACTVFDVLAKWPRCGWRRDTPRPWQHTKSWNVPETIAAKVHLMGITQKQTSVLAKQRTIYCQTRTVVTHVKINK